MNYNSGSRVVTELNSGQNYNIHKQTTNGTRTKQYILEWPDKMTSERVATRST